MNFIQRAWLSTKAKKGRSLLLCAVFSAILIFILAGLTIQSASLKAAENAKKSMGATATLSANRENAFKNNTSSSTSSSSSASSSSDTKPDAGSFSLTPVPVSTAEKIAALSNVASYNLLSSTSAGAGTDITPISSSSTTSSSTTTSSSDSAQQNGPGGGASGKAFGPGNAQGDFSISGVLTSSLASDFSSGTAKIVSGTGITSSDKGTNNVVIEKSLADANSLKVGDKFTISNPTDETTTYTVTIKGIYKVSSSSSDSSLGNNFNFLNPSNTIYTSYTFANTLKGSSYKDTVDSVSYTLSDPAKMDTFVAAAKKLIDTESFSIETNDQVYQQMIQPISNVSSFAKNIVLLVTVAGIIILALIVMMMIRERRYEIGVLLSIGESRTKMILQFFVELFMIMVVALVIATFSGRVVGNVVGQQLLDQQTTSQTTTSSNQTANQPGGGRGQGGGNRMNNLGASSATNAKQIKKLNVTLSTVQIIKLGGLGLLICFISVLLSSIGIVRLQPKKILT
ncbi:ABC transporter permease [Vagococcus entomophilus]|uniref:ABC transporter permease n=1 Tax=Vagococcus entomophilus TaxID=1160095 RepID=A0A430AH46_9ENTE|nr:ABC transporter permease [Vagococcus entomophilus]RSU07218.1 ABC transporter permease [Vagococcus entomophilus]